MNYIKIVLLGISLITTSAVFSQAEESKDAITSEWQTISMGKLQKNPVFKEPMISVRFIYENGKQFFNLSLKYMFTDAVFEEAVPVEYYKNERMECVTKNGKHELRAARYAKARRMSTIAQKTADMRVIFSGDLSFFANELVKNFTVHYAQGYQDIKLNEKEADNLRIAYNKFQSILPKVKEVPNVKIEGVAPKAEKSGTESKPVRTNSLDRLRKKARNWGK